MLYPGGAADGGDLAIGISICEDIWNDSQFWKSERLYEHDPVESLVASGANLIVNVSASPFMAGKPPRRQEMLRHAARRWRAPVVLVNQVGGCDQIIFDGGSCVMLPDGAVPAATGWFRESTAVWDTADRAHADGFDAMLAAAADEVAGIREALTLGLCDYLAKTGFSHVIVGNSGGIDSAVVLTLAVSALGSDSAISVSMPGPFTSEATRADSAALARNLGVRHIEVPIAGPFAAFGALLQSPGAPLVETAVRRRPRGALETGGREHPGAHPWQHPDVDIRTRSANRARWCFPRATRARWRPATARSTGTCAAALP